MRDSLLSIERQPWVFIIEFFRYLLFGTGLLLAPVLQLAIFTSSHFLDATGAPSKANRAKDDDLPDIEIMPVSYCPFIWALQSNVHLQNAIVR